MVLRRLRWLLLLTVAGAVALWPFAVASGGTGEDNVTPKVQFDYAKRQNFIGGEWVRFRVRTTELTTVNASGNLEVGTAPKKYGRNLWPIGGVGENVKRGEEAVLRMHVPRNVRIIAHRARAAGKKLVIRLDIEAFDKTGNAVPDFVAVIRPTS